MISAKVIADSKNEFGNRITTMVVTMPRFILAEFNTHRMFSRNSASSRAIPFEKMVKSVEENPFIPIAWQKDHKGMQGIEYFSNNDPDNGIVDRIDELRHNWLNARDKAIISAESLHREGVTKQLCNRLLEPFMYHTVIVTATEWENFFALRCPQYQVTLGVTRDVKIFRSRKDVIGVADKLEPQHHYDALDDSDWLKINKGQAEIHMMALAEAMWDAYNESTPKELKAEEWHIPFGDDIEMSVLDQQNITTKFPDIKSINDLKVKIATARCARVSYTVVGEEDKTPNYDNDIKLHDRLAASGHWSPMEHCAKSMTKLELYGDYEIDPSDLGGNFKGFIQYRKMFNNENITK